MSGVEDEIQTPPMEDPSSSLMDDHRKLKRLKKASEVADPLPQLSRNYDVASTGGVPDPKGLAEFAVSFESPCEGKDFDDGLDPLFGGDCRLYESGVESLVSEAEINASEDVERHAEGVEDMGKKGSAKRRLNLDEGGEMPKKKKEASAKHERKDRKSMESSREKKKLGKERKVYLEQLHAESQKLLRETRDASFKPVVVADKPISSVLEKIRMRKQELLKRNSATNDAGHHVRAQCPTSNIDVRAQCPTSNTDVQAQYLPEQDANEEEPEKISRSEEGTQGSVLHESANNSLLCDTENAQSIDCTNEIQDNSDADLGQNSDNSDESSSEEEEYDKENINPVQERPSLVNLYRKNDLIKGFVDEEAEEEDDSDHDMIRFRDDDDDDEDDDNDEAEVLTDLIAPGYKEKSSDADKRNELHQKWLQYQDASDTDNLLQRLNSHATNLKTPLMIHKEDADDDDDNGNDDDADDDDDDDDDDADDLNPPQMNSARQNVLQAKKNISQMFTDCEDAYVSDDEETEMSVLRSSLSLDHSLEKSSALAPPDDENSREVFDLIRKTNSLPEKTKRKSSSLTANFDTLVIKGNGVSFKKLQPSFLGRATINGMTSSTRHVSSSSRSFVFSRDDSNSRSSDLSETIPDASRTQPPKTIGQEKSTLKRISEESSSSGSLFQILRRTCGRVDQSSLTSVKSGGDRISSSQTVHQFSSFRLTKKTS